MELCLRSPDHLVDRSSGRTEAIGDHIDGDLSQRERGQHSVLHVAELLLAYSPEQTKIFMIRIIRGGGPALFIGRQRARLPCPSPESHTHLDNGELSRPCCEPALAVTLLEAFQHGVEGLIGSLAHDVISLFVAKVGCVSTATRSLKAGGRDQKRSEPTDSFRPCSAAAFERSKPCLCVGADEARTNGWWAEA